MENFYPPLSERDYRQDFQRLATEFLPALEDLPANKQWDFLQANLNSLSDAQRLVLIQCELWTCFDDLIKKAYIEMTSVFWRDYEHYITRIPHLRNEAVIFKDEEFEKFFLIYIQMLDKFQVKEYLGFPVEDMQEVLDVERFVLKQKLEILYQNHQRDIHVILDISERLRGNYKEALYKIPYFGLTFFVESEVTEKPRGDINGDISIKLDYSLPILKGRLKDLLTFRIQEAQDALSAYKKQANVQITIAKQDLKNVMQNYQKHNKIIQSVCVDLNTQLSVGKMQMRLETKVYWQRNDMGGFVLLASIALMAYASIEFLQKGFLLAGTGLLFLGLFPFIWYLWKSYR